MNLLSMFMIIVIVAYSTTACFAERASFTYSAKQGNMDYDMKDYYLIVQSKNEMKRAGQYDRDGKKNLAEAVRWRLRSATDAFDSIEPAEKALLQKIWEKAANARLIGDLYFNSEGGTGSVTHIVTAITPNGIPSKLKAGETNVIDCLMDDVCKLRSLKYISLRYSSVNTYCLAGLTNLNKLEHFDAPLNITDDTLIVILRAIPSIKYLELWGCENITGAFAKDKKATEHLREITMIGTGLNTKHLLDIISLPDIKCISLEKMKIYIDGMSNDALHIEDINEAKRGKP